MKEIKGFYGKYRPFSNFWPCTVTLNGKAYPSVEHAYQAAKTLDELERLKVFHCETAKDAKRVGKQITLREDWEEIKDGIMYSLVSEKFNSKDYLRDLLLSTEKAYLEETNYWGDTYWGVSSKTGEGQNRLGKILMRVRFELKME